VTGSVRSAGSPRPVAILLPLHLLVVDEPKELIINTLIRKLPVAVFPPNTYRSLPKPPCRVGSHARPGARDLWRIELLPLHHGRREPKELIRSPARSNSTHACHSRHMTILSSAGNHDARRGVMCRCRWCTRAGSRAKRAGSGGVRGGCVAAALGTGRTTTTHF
jgi:hypothetical protein